MSDSESTPNTAATIDKPLTAKERYALYLLTPEWKERRREAIKRDGKKCTQCGSKQRLQVHHLTYARKGDERPSDLVTLCRACHCIVHGLPSPYKQKPPKVKPQKQRRQRQPKREPTPQPVLTKKQKRKAAWAKLYDPMMPADAKRMAAVGLKSKVSVQSTAFHLPRKKKRPCSSRRVTYRYQSPAALVIHKPLAATARKPIIAEIPRCPLPTTPQPLPADLLEYRRRRALARSVKSNAPSAPQGHTPSPAYRQP
jgi:5-methylcytosine-specific restriction endonuclease McrA